jgi:hypothetical protein
MAAIASGTGGGVALGVGVGLGDGEWVAWTLLELAGWQEATPSAVMPTAALPAVPMNWRLVRAIST